MPPSPTAAAPLLLLAVSITSVAVPAASVHQVRRQQVRLDGCVLPVLLGPRAPSAAEGASFWSSSSTAGSRMSSGGCAVSASMPRRYWPCRRYSHRAVHASARHVDVRQVRDVLLRGRRRRPPAAAATNRGLHVSVSVAAWLHVCRRLAALRIPPTESQHRQRVRLHAGPVVDVTGGIVADGSVIITSSESRYLQPEIISNLKRTNLAVLCEF